MVVAQLFLAKKAYESHQSLKKLSGPVKEQANNSLQNFVLEGTKKELSQRTPKAR